MEILHYSAFTTDPDGGNQAGVILPADTLDSRQMQAIAAKLGYSESAFLSPRADGSFKVRYFAPAAEVPFCGHATIAAAVALARKTGPGPLTFHTAVGEIPVVTRELDGILTATLTSVDTKVVEPAPELAVRLLAALRLRPQDLDPALPLLISFSGNWHPMVPVASAAILAGLDYDFAALEALMAEQGWQATVSVMYRVDGHTFEVRNPFPPGGVREDAATGSAAASLGGYLRHLGLVALPADVTVHQGHHMGRPSLLTVHIPETGGIDVSGSAVPLDV
ncbi:phenazine biosynthesis protein PhzF [Arthrobacter sp. ERGS1:01]|uniref:PhzF family phenazine biosynthesis protein n=1 Tax=Arthrobacter sp. ERGS1:01 TaxID=1704044 RepID=UPI0006B462B6|nr:PhzF family phenazine biosynthesis protein [Arthrobacter sp. ERGS1:01]ALE05980.1 phenazine biosynthesis protein PhzF [Arthrobacter sp. ERGS1:01]